MSLGPLPTFQALLEASGRQFALIASLVGLSARCREQGDTERADEIDTIVKEARGE